MWDEGDSHDENYVPTTERVFPVKADNRSVPGAVAAEYNRALRVKQIDASCYALVIRRMLESICNDKHVDATTTNKKGETVPLALHTRLERLAKREEWPPIVKDLAIKLKDLLNLGAHVEARQVDDHDVPGIAAGAELVLEYVYRGPALVGALEERLAGALSAAAASG